jgi:hypothetical protein
LENQIGGFRRWNLDELRLVKRNRSQIEMIVDSEVSFAPANVSRPSGSVHPTMGRWNAGFPRRGIWSGGRKGPLSREVRATKMGWEAFNLSLMEAGDFSIDARNLILKVFDNASQALDDEWKRESEFFKQAIGEAYKVEE